MNTFIVVILLVLATSISAWPYMASPGVKLPAHYDQGLQTETADSSEPTGPRAAKLSASLQQGIDSAYSNLPGFAGKDITSPVNLLKFTTESMIASFDTVSDELPNGRKKYIHPIGTVAGAQFIPTVVHEYTGMFKGADSCLVRLSLAADPVKIGFTPGMAMKCFADGPSASANFIAMFSLDGQKKNYDFFTNEFSNIIASPTNPALIGIEEVAFKRASRCPVWLSLYQFGATDQYGNGEVTPVYPIELWLVPGEISFPTANNRDFRNDLATVPIGSTIWTVQVSDSKGGPRKEFGKIVTTSEFVASSWADNVLFFQHSLGEFDDCPKE